MVFDVIADKLVELTNCNRDDITRDTKLLDLGVDSLDVVEMLMDLEGELGQEIELTEKVETVGELTDYIERERQA